ncbi:MAG: hypothetical protein B6D53_01910 [Candidatus Omnitrophica bacterium 4484_49]|nr:hypothetical protein [Candidatus Omnitrophota bacterium]OQX83670.1 MAG: hypothetical protein B6D53_01910 [Candidatus Omnitrophica bacterium 4484_49]
MAVRCPKCGKEYDIALFQFGSRIRCDCGEVFSLKEANRESQDEFGFLKDLLREIEVRKEDEKVLKVQREADKICQMILNPGFDRVDIEIAKQQFLNLLQELFPDKIHLYDLIFEPRFQRLWEQFRR